MEPSCVRARDEGGISVLHQDLSNKQYKQPGSGMNRGLITGLKSERSHGYGRKGSAQTRRHACKKLGREELDAARVDKPVERKERGRRIRSIGLNVRKTN